MRWHLLDTPALPGAANMAWDAALLDRARTTGEAVLRLYAWARPTISFGRHETTRGRYDPARVAAAGADAVRRGTGGRALWHHRELTYSITAPAGDGEPIAASVARFHGILIAALARLGVCAAPATAPMALRPDAPSPCFAAPAPGELVVAGRKVVASAQVREQGALLQHGSLLLHDDQHRLVGLGPDPIAPPAPAAALATLLRREPDERELRATMADALRAWCTAAGDPPPTPLDPEPLAAAVAAHEARFQDPAWTWRR